MRKSTLRIAGAIALALIADTATAAPKEGDTLRFVGTGFDGQPLDLSVLRGRVVVVDLWATWCTPCRVEMPVLDELYRARAGKRLVIVVGLSADRPRDANDARHVMTSFHFPGAMLSSAKVNDFGAPRALPVTYVLDREGKVTATFGAGGRPFSRQELEAAVDTAGG